MNWEVSESQTATVTVAGLVLAGMRNGQVEICASDSGNYSGE